MPDQDGFPLPLEKDLTFRDTNARLVPDIKYEELKVPYLGIARPPLRLFTFQATIGDSSIAQATRIQVPRPTLLLPVEIDPAFTTTFISTSFSPQDPANRVSPTSTNVGLKGQRGACYLWAPGNWWVFPYGDPGGTTEFVRYVGVQTEEQRILERFLDPKNGAADNSNLDREIVLPAATTTTIITTRQALLSNYVLIENVGANLARLSWELAPTGTAGFSLSSNEKLYLEGLRYPVARCRAFSTAGTTIRLQFASRDFVQSL